MSLFASSFFLSFSPILFSPSLVLTSLAIASQTREFDQYGPSASPSHSSPSSSLPLVSSADTSSSSSFPFSPLAGALSFTVGDQNYFPIYEPTQEELKARWEAAEDPAAEKFYDGKAEGSSFFSFLPFPFHFLFIPPKPFYSSRT